MAVVVGDTESDGLKHQSSLIWVICEYNLEDKTFGFSFDESVYRDFDIKELVNKELENKQYRFYDCHEDHLRYMLDHEVVMHNYFQHDKPLLRKFYKWWSPAGEGDTFILSQLYNPDRQIPQGSKGAHGLDAWGNRFGVPKPKHEDWTQFSPEMLHRVIEDVKINVLTWYELEKEAEGWDWELSKKIEYGVADIMGRQEMHGVYIDQPLAYDLADEIYQEIQKIDETLLEQMPPRVIQQPESAYEKAPFTKAGGIKKHVSDWLGHDNVQGPFCRVSFEKPNLNSPAQLKDFLLTQGWVPTEYTEKGSPKLTEDSYDSIKGELGQLIAKRAVLKHRAGIVFNINKQGQLKGVLNVLRDDGRVEAAAMTNGTNTGRMTHIAPVVNIPKPKDKLWKSGIQLRDLFAVPEGKLMMGIDADALEARCEAAACLNFPGGKEYAKELLEGDVHSATAFKNGGMTQEEYKFYYRYKVEGKELPEDDKEEYERLNGVRDFWKSPRYACTYGAQPPKLNKTLGYTAPKGCNNKCWNCPPSRKKLCKGYQVHHGFWESNTALAAFREAIVKAWKQRKQSDGTGYIRGIDGRKVWIRSEHSVVNAYFQNMGSVAVKVAALFFDKWLQQRKIDATIVIVMHDEYETECWPGDKKIIKELAEKSFTKAGEFLKIPVPITGTAEFGHNWHDVH